MPSDRVLIVMPKLVQTCPAPDVARPGCDMGEVDGLFLSHGHWDHAGGMLAALGLIRQAKPQAAVPTDMHPGMYRRRAMRGPDGRMREFEDVPSAGTLQQHGAQVCHATEARLVLEDLFFLSGEIPRLTPFEKGMPGQHRRTEDGTGWRAVGALAQAFPKAVAPCAVGKTYHF